MTESGSFVKNRAAVFFCGRMMNMVLPPCKDCPDRVLSCHSRCERFAEYQRKKDVERKAIQRERDRFSEFPAEIKKKLNKRAKQKLTQ